MLLPDRMTDPDDPSLADACQAGMFIWLPKEDRLEWSGGLLRLYGLERPPEGEAGFLAFVHPDDRGRVDSETTGLLGSKASRYARSFRIVRPNGAVRYILDRGTIERDADGAVRAIRGLNIDLTDVAHIDRTGMAREAARGTPDRGEVMQAVLESTPDLVWAKDREGRITFGNTALFQAIGDGGPATVLGGNAAALVPDAAQAGAIEANDALVLRDGVPIRVEERLTRAGTERLYQTVKAPLRGAGGGIVGIVGISRDITEQKTAEAQLHARTQQLDLLARTASRLLLHEGPELPLAEIVGDMAALVEAGAYFHYRPLEPDLLGLELAAGLDAAAQAEVAVVRYGALLCGRVAETRAALVVEDLQHANQPGAELLRDWGATCYAGFPLLAEGRLIGTLAFAGRVRTHFAEGELRTLQAICDQVAVALERGRLAGQLRETHERVRFALRAAGAGAWEWHIPSGRLEWSLENYALYDVDPLADGPHYSDWQERLHPDDRAPANAAIAAAVAGQVPELRTEFRVVRRDGSLRWLVGLGQVERAADGSAVRLSGINFDITARKLAEAELAEANALLESLFANAPVGIAVWDSSFRFTRLNAELAAMNGLPAEAHLGRRPDEILPEIAGIDDVYAKWREVLDTGEPWRDVEISGATPARPGLVRHWRESFFPVGIGGRNVAIAAIVTETTEQKRAEAALQAAHDTFRHLVERSPFGIFAVDADFRLVQVSDGAQRIFETVRPLIGRDFAEVLRILWPEPFAGEAIGRFRQTLATGLPYHAPTTVEQRADIGATEAYDWKIERITMPDGRPGVVCHFYDLSERQRHEARVQVLLREVNHRAKNMLGLIQAIARHTVASGASDFLARFGERVRALAAAQDLLVHNEWRSVPVADLVRAQLAHFADIVDRRIVLAGPAVALTPAAAQALGMAFHELATNAAKYGALSVAAGQVEIRWNLAPAPEGAMFEVSWVERGGPAVALPQRRGFGSTLTTGMVESSVSGVVTVDYAPGGVEWRLRCPAAQVMDGAVAPVGGARATAHLPEGHRAEDRRRVLVVEDEALIAAEMAEMLAEAGYDVVGPATSVRQALALLAAVGCDVAVLDVTLGSETSEPVAQALARSGRPYVVVSGYSRAQLPETFRTAPLADKPVRPEMLRTLIQRCLKGAEPA